VILSAENLKVRYRNGALGVFDVGLEVDAGQVVLIFGPNGAGKTTTVRAVSGFLKTEGARVVDGKITLFGEDTTHSEPQRTARLGLAFVSERRKIFPNMSVADNLNALGRRPPRQQRQEIYERVYGLFPTLAVNQRQLAGRLSGGQQQMLAIARGLVSQARLVVIDEMTLGLHHSVHGALFGVMKTIAATGAGVLIVDESARRALDIADYCYLLGGGRVRMAGPPGIFVGNELLAAGYVEAP
jgi:branched-chain amino acid transport system ATP-binding protein